MPKRCLLQDEEAASKYKPLVFSILPNPLIFRVFASEGMSGRNFSLIFWVEQKTPTEKSKSGYNPKVAHIAFLSEEEKALKYTHNICCPVKVRALLFLKKQTSDKTTGRTAFLCSTPGCSTYSISVISFL